MSGLTRARIVCFVVLFLMLTVPWSVVIEPSSNDVAGTELSNNMVSSASAGDVATQLHLYGDGTYSNQFTIDVPATAPVTDLHLSVKPAITPSSTGFSWDSDSIWSHTDAMKEGAVVTSEGYLTGSIAGTIWDFNNGLQGWTVSSSTYISQYTTSACGFNGSQGGSLKTQASSTPEHATSPSTNLASITSIPLHIWIRQGSSGCGEEADSGEDLKLQYKTATGAWVTLQTWLGSTAGGTPQQWSGVLPSAALHSTSQLRFEQVRGSGTCCDFWFIDDVHLASPLVSNWTSPSFGWSSTSAIQAPQNTYAPLTIDAFIPTGAMLNWSVHQANGNVIPGFKDSNNNQIPLNLLDASLYDSLRIKLSFKVGSNGELPLVYSISGDGASSTLFTEQQPMENWTSVCDPDEQFIPYGPVTDLSIVDDGWAYLSTSSASTISARGTGLVAEISATPYLLNQTDYISSPTAVGHLYTSATGVSTSGGTGSGLTVNTVASSITMGLVDGVNLVDAGTGYTSQTASPTGGSGSGVRLSLTASTITASGLVAQSSSLVGGSGYTTATGVLSSGGNGSNLTLNIVASPIIPGIVTSSNGLYGGTNYSNSSNRPTTGGTGTGLRVGISNVIGGSVGSVTIRNGGSNYLVGDKIYITQGDNDAFFSVSGITRSGGAITSISINNPGENYLVGNTVNLSGGDGNAYFSISQVVREGGSITSFTITNQGTGYSVNNLLSISGGDGNGQFSVGSVHHIGGNISSISIGARGTGYAIGDQMSISGGNGAGTFTINAVRNWGGEITTATVQNGGQYYALGDEVTVQGGAQNATLGVSGIEPLGYRGDSNCTLTMDKQHLIAPASAITGSVTGTNILLQLLDSSSSASWVTVTTPNMFNYSSSTPLYDLQFRIVALDVNLSYWSIDSFDYRIHYGQVTSNPRIDFYDDQDYEWGTSIANLGTWGWQNHFSNGNLTTTVQPGLSGYASTTILVPQTDIHSFGFGAISPNHNITGYALIHQSQVILSKTLEPASLHNIILNASERSLVEQSISGQSGLNQLGTKFIEMDIELYGSGPIILGGLLLTYTASDSVQFQTNSPFIMNLNDARRGLSDIGGVHHIPLPLTSSQKGGISVQILGLNTTSSVTLIDSEWSPESNTLTPSQRWRTVSMVHSVIGASPSAVRLDVVDSNNHATWVIPLSGGTPYGTGDFDLLALHPSNAVTYNHSGTTVTVEVTFRILPLWDDADVIRISTRLQLMNSILSMPSTFTFGNFASLGYENDLEIKNVIFSAEGDGTALQVSDYYLRTGMSLKLSIVVGFENVSSNDAFMDGDAILSLYRGGTFVANTTSLDDNIWNYTDTIPFTSGPLTWRLELTSLNGFGLTDASIFERTFHIDSVIPRVLETNVGWYDHREPSTTQTMHIQITDQPELPTNVHAKVWRQWLEDDNMNGWPDPGEYSSMSLLIPSNLDSLIGQYTLLLDDSGGSIGQKVAVYIVGQDTAGYAIKDAGSNQTGEHLFMYQLAPDGPPTIPANAFSWQDGRQAWLHPDMPYVLEVDISEPNGGSDLATVEVALAGNQGSDPLLITWDFETGNCTSSSTHIIVDDCKMMGANELATPYEKDMTLQIELHLAWTMPDLGETRREPIVTVIDRAGQEATRSFPENRWKFSAAMEVPEESVNLHLSSGTLLSDGARLGPNSAMEISGGVVFSETGTIPEFNCTIYILFAGESKSALAQQGIWNIALTTPGNSGTIPLTWSIGCMPEQGIDATDKGASVRWIVVDGEGPIPVEILSPRTGAILDSEQHEVRIVVSEEGGIDIESLQLVWWVEDKITGEYLRDGTEPMLLAGNEIEGLRLELTSTIDLTGITDNMLEDKLQVYVRIDGRDLAGNQILGFSGTPTGTIVAQWGMIFLEPEYYLEPSSVTYSRLLVEVGQTTSVQISVQNVGTLDGTTDAVITAVSLDGTRTTVRRTSVNVPSGGIGIINLDWGPESSGLQWIEVTLADGETANGPSIDVRPEREVTTGERIFGDVHPVLGTLVGILFLSIIITGLIWAKRLTNNKGSKEHYDWDEYSSELEDDEDDEQLTHAGAVAAVQSQAQEEVTESDWKLGADGYWWYHDKVTDQWWYKDAEGEIVQFS